MGHHHALGHTCGARGKDHVGDGIGAERIERGGNGGIIRPLPAGDKGIEARIHQHGFGKIGQVLTRQ